ncbi:MAG: ABC transporter permease [Candidatus Cloacimonetes bacterium]|nr:ABC transporter permease [Candidatus Cloacimonadota bacterium]
MLYHFIIALRRIRKGTLPTLINICGLSISLAAFILIMIWVLNEINYDKFHENYADIFRVNLRDVTYNDPHNYISTPPPLANDMLNDFLEIKHAATYKDESRIPVKYMDIRLNADISFCNRDFFSIFTFPLVAGNIDQLFDNPHTILLTADISEKLYGDADPVGKNILIGHDQEFSVAGVLEEIPSQSTLNFEILTSLDNLEKLTGDSYENNWNQWSCETFILLPENTDKIAFSRKITGYATTKAEYKWIPELYLQPLGKIHLYNINGGGPILYVTIFSIVASVILLIACINFINLATAQALVRIKEISMRKILGASRKHLISQVITESSIMIIFSLFLSFGIIELIFPLFESLTGQVFPRTDLFSSSFILLLLGICLLTCLISGLYPALYLTMIKPTASFNQFRAPESSLIRKILITFQYFISIFLIISSIVVFKQLGYLTHQELGFNSEHVIYITLSQDLHSQYSSFKNELQRNPQIRSVTLTSDKIGISSLGSLDLNKWEGNTGDKQILVNILSVSYDFLETFNIEMAEGRFFSENLTRDEIGVVFNETAVQAMGLTDPVGTRTIDDYPILGVIKDFNYNSLHSEIKPLIILFQPDWYAYIAVKVDGQDLPATLKFIEKTYNDFTSISRFEYQFADAAFDQLYRSEHRMGILFSIFTFVAIVLSSLGLFGLSLFMVQRRLREIGIRKACGSSVQRILLLLSLDFIKWVLIAFVIAVPAAYYFLVNWLMNYAYRITMDIWIFLFAGSIALVVSLVTISIQAIRGANANPVDILKNE